MWRARLGERHGEASRPRSGRCPQYGLASEFNPPESPPGWTMTPLFQECERVKEMCAKLALENAALTARNQGLRGEVAALREDLATANIRVDEAEALRERDVHHIKLAIERLETTQQAQHDQLRAALDAQAADFARQMQEAATTRDDGVRKLDDAVAAREAALVQEQTALRAQANEAAAAARDEVEARCAASRREMADELSAAIAVARAKADSDASAGSEALAAARAETATLRASTEDRAAALEAAIASAAETVQRALETKLASLHSTLLRLDRQSKAHASQLDESTAEASGRARDAAEERAAIEARVVALESRLSLVEREAAAATRAARSSSPGSPGVSEGF